MTNSNGAGKRIALVIGNSAYQHLGYLDDPRRDAAAMAAVLQDLAFDDVISAIDLGQKDLLAKLDEFYAKLDRGGIALLFYAGHGVQVWGQNYLLPCDTHIGRASHLRTGAIPLNDIVRAMSRRTSTRLLFLDACRNDPLSDQAGGLARGARSTPSIGSDIADVGQGLAKITAAAGTFVAYATEPGNVALEGEGDNSPFTTALLRHVARPGLSIDDIMMEVRVEVLDETKGKQLPWSESALTKRFQFKEGPASDIARDFEDEYWGRVKDTDNPDFLESFLRQFPNGSHAEIARARIAGVRSRKESADWELARSTNTIAALADFMRRYPNGKRASVARTRLFLRQLGRGSAIVSAGVVGTLLLAILFFLILFIGLAIGVKYRPGDWVSEMVADPDKMLSPIIYPLLFLLAPSVAFGTLIWVALARVAGRRLARVAFSALIASFPSVILQAGVYALSPWDPDARDAALVLQRSVELEAAVYVAKRDPRFAEEGPFKQEVIRQEEALKRSWKSTYSWRVYYPLLGAAAAGLAASSALLLAGLAISGKKGLATWETPIISGALFGIIGVLILNLATVDDPWHMIPITSCSCWGSVVPFLAVGLSRAAAAGE